MSSKNESEKIERKFTYIREWSPFAKHALVCYLFGCGLNHLYLSYHSGKNALETHRKQKVDNVSSSQDKKEIDEYKIISQKIQEDTYMNLWESLWWPAKPFQNLAPNLVLYLNTQKVAPGSNPR